MRELVERAMGGDHEAFSQLAQQAVTRMYGIARLILRDNDRAKDAVQETLVATWRELPMLRDPDRFEAWTGRLLVRACYREARRQQRRTIVERSVRAIEGGAHDPLTEVADRDELERGFRRLSPEQRALLVHHYYLGLPLVQTAAILDLPVGTVKSRLHRATQALRAALEAEARQPSAQGKLA